MSNIARVVVYMPESMVAPFTDVDGDELEIEDVSGAMGRHLRFEASACGSTVRLKFDEETVRAFHTSIGEWLDAPSKDVTP